MDQETALKNLSMENEEGINHNKVEPIFHFVAHKAGMQKVNKEKVNGIILEASRGSRYYDKQMKNKIKRDDNIEKIKEMIENFKEDKQRVQGAKAVIEEKIIQLEKERNFSRTWVHVDMDMFYVACEIRDRPDLKEKLVVVGGMGYVNTANYIARQYGVATAMPGFIAKKLCPELIFIQGNLDKYQETSKRFVDVIKEYDLEYESEGIDGAGLDITDYLNENGITESQDIEKVCYEMRMKINAATGITCSCGIGPNKMLAKLSTEINKPNGQYYMKPNKEEILEFLSKLPVRKIHGVGNTIEQILNALQIYTCKGILNNLIEVYVGFTELTFDFLLRSALGVGRHYHEQKKERKSVCVQRTFQATDSISEIENKISEVANLVSENLQFYTKKAKHFTLTIKTHNFDIRSKGILIQKPTDQKEEILRICMNLFQELKPTDSLRLIGIKASNLNHNIQTLDDFFSKCPTKIPKIDEFEDQKQIKYKNNKLLTEMVQKDPPDSQLKLSLIHEPFKTDYEKQPLNADKVICPVCSKKFETSINYSKINRHLDECLSKLNANSEIPSNNASNSNKGSYKKMAPGNNLGNKQKVLETNGKRKPIDDADNVQNNFKKSKKAIGECNTIKLESFFNKK